MKSLFNPENISSETYGNKAFSLLQLRDWGFPVPEFIVLPATAFDAKGQFTSEFILQEFQSKIQNRFQENIFFAVRSSTNAEDNPEFSYAGQFRTELFVKKEQLQEAVLRVVDSVHSVLKSEYGNIKTPKMAVIIQEMVNAEVSGVAFGADPVTGARDTAVISAVWGLGEGLVSGALNADVWRIKGNQMAHIPAERIEAFRLDPEMGYGVKAMELSQDETSNAPLETEHLKIVTNWLQKLLQLTGTYPDIEFACDKNRMYLLQCRPITTLNKIPDKSGAEVVWDNSNIIESYPGLTLPLTFSFINGVYEAVYKEFSAVMGIRKKTIQANAELYRNMLGLIQGGVYYNLNSWYGALALLPGYTLNAGFMEKMMGVKEKLDIRVKPKSGLREILDIAFAIRKILGNLRTAKKQRDIFYKEFYEVLYHPRFSNVAGKGTWELVQDYREFETTLTSKWKAPLVNDFFCMIYFGLLQKQAVKLAGDAYPNLHNDLLSGAKDVVSAEPVKLIRNMLKEIKSSVDWKNKFEEENEQILSQELLKNSSKIGKLFQEYIEKWGDRTVAELKLETITYRMQPELLVRVLRNQLDGEMKQNGYRDDSRKSAEEFVAMALRGKPIKRWWFHYISKKAGYFVSNRENLRYERTRGFAKVREIFLQIGIQWKASGQLENARDIFYLKKEEIFDFTEGKTPDLNLKSLVELRKESYIGFETQHPAERITTWLPVYLGNNFESKWHNSVLTGDLKGIPCSAGVVTAKVRFITDPYSVASLNGDIIVTESTDPGWTALFATAGGILVQRGSLLSHAAIVSREMGIPCIVAIPELMSRLENGDLVMMDGSTGMILKMEN
ncbi:MAG: phosphoenolpyruvate synthase [Bacteroidetes bacterium]|nr:phosphoenolpyruvate synthase [Bacteroidota bacterium]